MKSFLDIVWDKATLGSMIASLRHLDNLKQEDLANKIGVSRQFISSIESNDKKVSIKLVTRIADALGYPAEPFIELLKRKGASHGQEEKR